MVTWLQAIIVILIALLAVAGNSCLFVVILTPSFKLRSTNNALILCLSGKSSVVYMYIS